jgi:hypothetical protein
MAYRPEGKGRSDLYLSYQRNGQWTAPLNLGDKVNSDAAEYSPKVSPDGKYFFWTSGRTNIKPAQDKQLSFAQLMTMIRSPGNGLLDIYYIDLGKLNLDKENSTERK